MVYVHGLQLFCNDQSYKLTIQIMYELPEGTDERGMRRLSLGSYLKRLPPKDDKGKEVRG